MALIANRLRLSPQVQDALLAVLVAVFQILRTRRVSDSQEMARLADPAYLGYALCASVPRYWAES